MLNSIYKLLETLLFMLDFVITKAINHFGSGTIIDSISYLISLRLFLVILLGIIMLLIFKLDKKYKKVIIALIVAIILYFLIGEVLIKIISPYIGMERTRPYLAFPDEIIPIGRLNTDSSFPSSHMSSTVAVAVILGFYYRKKWVWISGIIFSVLMVLSRLHNGMHYPTDVLGGIFLGLIYALISIIASEKLRKKI